MREIFLVAILLLVSGLYAGIIHVPGDYSGVEDAVNASTAGDTIIIAAGEYYVYELIIEHPLTIVGADSSQTTIIDLPVSEIILVDSDSVEFAHLRLKGYSTSKGGAGPAIFAHNCSNLRLESVALEGGHAGGGEQVTTHGGDAAYFDNVHDVNIVNSSLRAGSGGTVFAAPAGNGGSGLYLTQVSNVSIDNCYVAGATPGYSPGCQPGKAGWGIYVQHTDSVIIENTTIIGGNSYWGYAGPGMEARHSTGLRLQDVDLVGGHGGEPVCLEEPYTGGRGFFTFNSSADLIDVSVIGGMGGFDSDSLEYGIGGDGLYLTGPSEISVLNSFVGGGDGDPPGIPIYVDDEAQLDSSGVVTTIFAPEPQSPINSFLLHQNYPNPFNPSTVISLQLAVGSVVSLDVFDLSGRKVKSLVHRRELGAARHEVIWDGTNSAGERVTSGIYFYRLATGTGLSQTKRMILLK